MRSDKPLNVATSGRRFPNMIVVQCVLGAEEGYYPVVGTEYRAMVDAVGHDDDRRDQERYRVVVSPFYSGGFFISLLSISPTKV